MIEEDRDRKDGAFWSDKVMARTKWLLKRKRKYLAFILETKGTRLTWAVKVLTRT